MGRGEGCRKSRGKREGKSGRGEGQATAEGDDSGRCAACPERQWLCHGVAVPEEIIRIRQCESQETVKWSA